MTAKDGNDAIMQASSHNPDVVLLDLGLPDIDTGEASASLKVRGICAETALAHQAFLPG